MTIKVNKIWAEHYKKNKIHTIADYNEKMNNWKNNITKVKVKIIWLKVLGHLQKSKAF